jgi:hypothetical protein
MQRFLVVVVLVPVGLVSCKNDGAQAADPPSTAAPRALAGVAPDQWRCDSVAPLETLGALLGGTAKQIDSAASLPRGLPHPCNYEITVPHGAEFWTFDLDCRDGMKQRADSLFAQYRASSKDQVAHYEAMADAGAIKPSDAGIEIRPPEPAVEVFVGAKGLDHHGQALIFIDDDAPCYVRIVGKDAAHRLELAKLIAKNLTFANAPMSPRAFP